MVNFNSLCFSSGGSMRRFQSLKGILVNFNSSRGVSSRCGSQFQSLKGILVNFNSPRWQQLARFLVSIPQRDFGEFQLDVVVISILKLDVSIPQRDFGEFQLDLEH
ncbi:Epoxyqueuosine (oQ) reductase QueG [Geitlerinema sp. FC II]|nr:Epoxyqueuosine (oQ) reductase QueG [Geitlerinema sp. FC II]